MAHTPVSQTTTNCAHAFSRTFVKRTWRLRTTAPVPTQRCSKIHSLQNSLKASRRPIWVTNLLGKVRATCWYTKHLLGNDPLCTWLGLPSFKNQSCKPFPRGNQELCGMKLLVRAFPSGQITVWLQTAAHSGPVGLIFVTTQPAQPQQAARSQGNQKLKWYLFLTTAQSSSERTTDAQDVPAFYFQQNFSVLVSSQLKFLIPHSSLNLTSVTPSPRQTVNRSLEPHEESRETWGSSSWTREDSEKILSTSNYLKGRSWVDGGWALPSSAQWQGATGTNWTHKVLHEHEKNFLTARVTEHRLPREEVHVLNTCLDKHIYSNFSLLAPLRKQSL